MNEFFQIRDVRYSIERRGTGEPLVLLHGFTGSSRSWHPLVYDLGVEFDCIAIDLLGHGQTDAPAVAARYGMSEQTADLAVLLDQLSITRAHLLGYSMGGRIALGFACAYPNRVRSLVLESASPGIEETAERAARVESDEALAAFIEREGIGAFVERWEVLPLFSTQLRLPESVRAEQRVWRLANRPAGLANSLRGIGAGAQPPLWSQLAKLTMPTLLLVGVYDAKYVALAEAMKARIPGAQTVIVPNAGHTVHLEQPGAFLEAVAAFFKG